MWANLGQIKEMYSNEVYNIIIIVMIVIILWLWNMKRWVSELKGGGGGFQTPWTPPHRPLDPPLPVLYLWRITVKWTECCCLFCIVFCFTFCSFCYAMFLGFRWSSLGQFLS